MLVWKEKQPLRMHKKEQYLYRKTEIKKVNEASNYHPITFLPLTWKLLTGIIADEMYGFLKN